MSDPLKSDAHLAFMEQIASETIRVRALAANARADARAMTLAWQRENSYAVFVAANNLVAALEHCVAEALKA